MGNNGFGCVENFSPVKKSKPVNICAFTEEEVKIIKARLKSTFRNSQPGINKVISK